LRSRGSAPEPSGPQRSASPPILIPTRARTSALGGYDATSLAMEPHRVPHPTRHLAASWIKPPCYLYLFPPCYLYLSLQAESSWAYDLRDASSRGPTLSAFLSDPSIPIQTRTAHAPRCQVNPVPAVIVVTVVTRRTRVDRAAPAVSARAPGLPGRDRGDRRLLRPPA
jgi:hypothetical protein